jgi:hypothetical protein
MRSTPNGRLFPWSDVEIQRLRAIYEAAGPTGVVNLKKLVPLFFGKRNTANVCRKARELGFQPYSRAVSGKRPDLGGLYLRSRWEANYARYLNLEVKLGSIGSWEYEPKTFVFESIKRGTRSYTPDFLLHFADGSHVWHEVKGWMDDKSRIRLERIAKFYPDEKVVVIGAPWFKANARRLAGLIPEWE